MPKQNLTKNEEQNKPDVDGLDFEQEVHTSEQEVHTSEQETQSKWISPLDVSYVKLTELIGKTSVADYIGNRLPDEEVKRIEKDYLIYLKNK